MFGALSVNILKVLFIVKVYSEYVKLPEHAFLMKQRKMHQVHVLHVYQLSIVGFKFSK